MKLPWKIDMLLEDAKCSQAIFCFDDERSLTYQESYSAMCLIADLLTDSGITKRDVVVIITPNSIEAILILFAVSRLNAIFIILHNGISSLTLQNVLRQTQPALCILPRNHRMLGYLDTYPKLFVEKITELITNNSAAKSTNMSYDYQAPSEEATDLDPSFIIYTSGSTGRPRGIVVSHDNIKFSLEAIQQRLKYRSNDVISLLLPLSFDYGLYQIFLCAYANASIYIADLSAIPLKLDKFIKSSGTTIAPLIPGLVTNLIKLTKRNSTPLDSVRLITNTGEHLSQRHIDTLNSLAPHINIALMYGLTECKRVSILAPEELVLKPDSVGRALNSTEIYVVDESGDRLPLGESGELVVRGRHVTLGYWKDPKATSSRFKKAVDTCTTYLKTGDHVMIDIDGYIYFHNRIDNQIKRNGFRIQPKEIEDVALTHAAVTNAKIILDEDGSNFTLYIASKSRTLSREAVLELLRRNLEDYKLPNNIEVKDHFPMTTNYKIDSTKLRESA